MTKLEKYLNKFFQISIVLKSFLATLEVISGALFLTLGRINIVQWIAGITQEELTEDSRDYISTHILHAATQFSLSSLAFGAAYLLVHGAVKLSLLYGLRKGKRIAYPLSVFAFSLFLIYQFYRYQFTHSPWLIVLSSFDVLFVGLIAYEYRKLKTRKN